MVHVFGAAARRRHRPSVDIYYSCKKTSGGKWDRVEERDCEGERERQIYNIDWQIKCHCQRPRRSIPISHWYKTQRLVRPRIWCRRLKKKTLQQCPIISTSRKPWWSRSTYVFFFGLPSSESNHIPVLLPPRSKELVCSCGFKWHLERCHRTGCLYCSLVERHANSWSSLPWAATLDVYGWRYRFQIIADQKQQINQIKGDVTSVCPWLHLICDQQSEFSRF